MWSIFSRDPTKDFAFDIGEPVSGLENQSIWTLHKGKRKSNGEEVSVFVFDVSSSNESGKQTAESSVKRLKTLRHPNVLTFIDSLETDKFVYMVTESVLPLSQHVMNEQNNNDKSKRLGISWGIHQVVKGLSFINNIVNLIHNNVCMSSMFVDKAGEWKLGGIDYMYPASGEGSNIPPFKTLPQLEKYDPPEKNMKNRARKATKWSQDMWGVGCLIWEVFNGTLPRSSSLKVLGKIPKNLVTQYCELVGANPASRPPPDKFLESCRRTNNFMDNHFVKTNLFMEEIQIKDAKENADFFDELTSHIDDFPQEYSRHKILPQLLNAFQFGNAGSSVLPPLFKLGKLLGADEYQSKIVPCVIKLFSSTDRMTRINLLRQMPQFVEHLQPQVVNAQLFPNIVSGFMDSNPAIREQSIKAIVLLAPKLNDNNLNNELMKHFARLQSRDDQGPIRTNTTVCLGKIVPLLNAVTRQKVVSSAFMRAMRDPFPAARSSGVMAMANTIQYFTINDCAQKAIPSLSMVLVDNEKQVRDSAFKTIQLFIEKLKVASDDPERAAEMDASASVAASKITSNGQPSAVSGWGGWMTTGVSSITSRLYKKQEGGQVASAGPAPKNASSANATSADKPSSEATTATRKPNNTKPTTDAEPGDESDNRDDDQSDYGDEDGGGLKDTGWDDAENLEIDDDDAETDTKTADSSGWNNDESGWGNDDSAGWSDNWNDNKFEEMKIRNKSLEFTDDYPCNKQKSNSRLKPATPTNDGWNDWQEEEEEEDIQEEPKKKPTIPDPWATPQDTHATTTSSYNWDDGDTQDDFFNDFSAPKKAGGKKPLKSKPMTKKTAPQKVAAQPKQQPKAIEEDDWNSWGNDEDDGSSKQDEMKRQREEKKKERQEKLAMRKANKPKGGLKLGARKVD